MSRYIIIEPTTKTGKTLVAKLGLGGSAYRIICECRYRSNAEAILTALATVDERK